MAKPIALSFLLLLVFLLGFFNGGSPAPYDVEDMEAEEEAEALVWLNEEDDNGVIMVQTQPRKGNRAHRECDLTAGKWVFDESYPLYESTCPYLSTAVTCRKNGRPDSDYERWRWQPSRCSLPRYMRSKRIMLVGDSIMRNQWESLVCLVQGVIPMHRKRVTYDGPTMSFHALDFGVSIEFCWAPLLVELQKDAQNKRVVHLDSIEDNARHWRGVDVLVFDSAHWWTHVADNLSSWDYYMEGNRMIQDLNPMVAYEKGMTTWARWVDLNLQPRKSKVIFRSMSPRHNRQNGWKCYKQREPLLYASHIHVAEPTVVLKRVLHRMRFPVELEDITNMSALRRDGHPSVYAKAPGQEEKRGGGGGPHSHSSSDCSHWCLPGVPDTWNEMLNAIL
ncbi:hypothetical protein V2J09_002370 [Rumex salicifolius]